MRSIDQARVIRSDRLRIGAADPGVDPEEAGDNDREGRHAEPELAHVALQQAGHQHAEGREDGQRVELQTDQQRRDSGHQEAAAAGALPLEHQRHVGADARDQKHVHASRLRILDEIRKQRHGGDERQIPRRLQETPTCRPGEQDQQHPAQGGRQPQRPLALSEGRHRAGHEVELGERARIEHAAGHPRRAALNELHRRQSHGFLIAVQPHSAEAPEADRRADDHDEHQQPQARAIRRRPRVPHREQRGKPPQKPLHRNRHYRPRSQFSAR